MKKYLLTLSLLTALSSVFAQMPRLKVSDNRRFLVTADNRPFFWQGDTAWELFHRLKREEADYYFRKRAEQGYTVIQAVVLAEFDGLHTPNAYGRVPFYNDDPEKPNEEYFRYIDELVTLAGKYGLYVAMLPTWGDKLFKNTWGTGPEIWTTANAAAYGKWIGKRYAAFSNIIWVLGGDRNPRPGSADVEVWRKMAAGIRESAGPDALMTYHPQPSRTSSSSPWFHADDWLSFNMLQTGHCRDLPVWESVAGDYRLTPIKPVVNGEPIYEDHPVCFNAADLGYSSAYDCRKAAYLSVFAGAFGHTYGCHDIWQFYDKGREAVNGPLRHWKEAMELTFAGQLRHLQALVLSRPFLERIPDGGLVAGAYSPAERVETTRGKDYAFVYSALGKPIILRLDGKLTGNKLTAWWYNPRNGEAKNAGIVENTGRRTFTPPSNGQGQDWVLVLDDASRNYAAPGKTP